MSSDLRVALRIQATSGSSRREIQAIERDLRKAGKDGAKALADESGKATNAISKTGQAGAASYKIIRQAMREATTQGSGVFRQGVLQTTSDLKQLGQVGRQAARETKAELVRTAREGVDPLRQSVDRAETSFRRLAQNGGRNLRLLKSLATGVREEFNRIKGLGIFDARSIGRPWGWCRCCCRAHRQRQAGPPIDPYQADGRNDLGPA